MAEEKKVQLRIKRQDGPGKEPYWEDFSVPYRKNMNVIICLMEIQKAPVTAQGKETTPVAWECSCLEEVCGACSMVINGKVRQSCSALVEELEQPIVLEPMKSFPLIRDLMVDRSKMFDALKKVHAWIDIDGSYALGPGPRQSPADQEWMYELSKCMTCGCCLEACPNWHADGNAWIGPQAVAQVRLFNGNPTGKLVAHERLEALLEDDGIANCGNSQNCVEVCPKGIPLTESLAFMNKAANSHALRKFFTR